ncbi:unnamed protein product [Cylindrotheca closterium]|uniref:DUF6824 domain-containing protein n=1 Tax=Cylindrotheca closterium TaxID=2856 RepID=A0AAD2CG37_9STRA|nr:unnamed protein product [Cylindrotheca closterium]
MQGNNNTGNNDVPADVRPYDILCGRSKTCFNNIGNRRFRITISMNLKKYDSLPNRTERGKFIFTLAQTLQEDAGFRFVRISKKNGRVELTNEEIRAKIGHALRDLSKAQAEATVAAAKPAEEAKKFMSSTAASRTTSPTTTKEPSAAACNKKVAVITPQLPQRQVYVAGAADVDDIRKEMMMVVDSSSSSRHISVEPSASSHQQQQQHQVITSSLIIEDDEISEMTQDIPITLPQHEMMMMLPDCCGEAHNKLQPMKVQALKPAPIHTKVAAEVIGDDHYCLMPLQFDEKLNKNQILLEPASKSTFDDDDNNLFIVDSGSNSSFEGEFLRRCSLH